MSRPHGWSSRAPRARIPEGVRRYVLARDGYVCRIKWDEQCTVDATEADHIVTVQAGGHDGSSNLRAACSHCNAQRNIATRPKPASSRRPVAPPPGLIG